MTEWGILPTTVDWALGATVVGYALLGLLLLSLNLASRWRWWIKGIAIVLTTGFFAGSYFTITGMQGWPTRASMPERFQLLWTRVVEPDRHSGEEGAIFLWVESLDANNVPSGRPRSYEFPYSKGMARGMEKMQERLEQGEEIQGSIAEAKSEVKDKGDTDIEEGTVELDPEAAAKAIETVPFMDEHMEIHFQELPPIVLPDKPARF